MRILILILVLSVFLFSGCTGITGNGNINSGMTGNGIVIEKFEPVISQKYSGEPVAFRVKLINTGTETAYDVEARLTNVEEFDVYNEPVQFFDKIPSDTLGSGNNPELTWSWDLDAPYVPAGTTVKFNPAIRVIYTYKAETIESISIVPEVELRALQDSGKSLPAEISSKSRGPISLDIEVKGPIHYYERRLSFPVNIIVRNNGNGILCRDLCEDPDKDLNVLDIYLHNSDVKLRDCSTHDIRMTGGTATIVCTMEFEYNPVDDKNEVALTRKKNIHFDTVYTYTVDKTTELSVTGK